MSNYFAVDKTNPVFLKCFRAAKLTLKIKNKMTVSNLKIWIENTSIKLKNWKNFQRVSFLLVFKEHHYKVLTILWLGERSEHFQSCGFRCLKRFFESWSAKAVFASVSSISERLMSSIFFKHSGQLQQPKKRLQKKKSSSGIILQI